MSTSLPGLAQLARLQDHVVSRSQLAGIGADYQVVDRRTRAGTWQLFGPRVVVLHNGRLTREQRWWAAYLHGSLDDVGRPVRAALCGLTAIEAGGLVGFEAPVLHVVVEHGRQVTDLESRQLTVRVHETRLFETTEVHPTRQPPRLRLPRSIVQCASDAAIRQPDRARSIIAAAVQQRLVRPEAMRRYAVARRTLPGRRLLLETISDAQGGAHSLPELEFLRGVRSTGLPEPRRQRALQRANGTWYLDNDFGDYLVTIEVNGLQHYEQIATESDEFRRAVLEIGGRLVVGVSSYAVRHQIARCMIITAEALISRGYRPPRETAQRLDALWERAGWTRENLLAS
jgi:hypothetical protein